MPYALLNGQEIYYEDSGGNGFPVVMMHGFLMDQSLFDPQVKAFAPNYRCIRFDARAFGQTRWDQKAFNLYDTASDCIGLMDHLSIEQAVIAGMSQGGYAALRCAITRPERVFALVLLSTQASVDDGDFQAQCREARDTWREHGPVDPLLNALAQSLMGPKNDCENAKHWQTWQTKWKTYSGEAIFHAMNNLLDRDDISSKIPKITHPALVVHGDADFGVPLTRGQKLNDELPNSHGVVIVPGAAHAANYTHSSIVNHAILEFLRQLALQEDARPPIRKHCTETVYGNTSI